MAMTARLLIVTGVVGALFVSSALSQVTTSPGKAAVFAADSLDSLPTGSFASLLSAQIAKGKSKRVLRLDATVAYEPGLIADCALSLWPKVNGVEMWPGLITFAPCGGSQRRPCVANGAWWLDLDAAEVAHPGVFKGQPLQIELLGKDQTDVNCASLDDGTATMSVEMVKK